MALTLRPVKGIGGKSDDRLTLSHRDELEIVRRVPPTEAKIRLEAALHFLQMGRINEVRRAIVAGSSPIHLDPSDPKTWGGEIVPPRDPDFFDDDDEGGE